MSKILSPNLCKAGGVAVALGLVALLGQSTVFGSVHPSSACHVTDGAFTDCSAITPGSPVEWFDVPGFEFLNGDSVVYFNQDPLDPPGTRNLYLMYDQVGREFALGPNEFSEVEFDTDDDAGGGVIRYVVRFFGDNSIQVFRDGVNQGRGAPGQPVANLFGAVGFRVSPNSAIDHLIFELEIPLASGAGSGLTGSGQPAGARSYSARRHFEIAPVHPGGDDRISESH